MVLAWTEPANNGGADIRGYFIDYRTVKGGVVGKWHEMNHKALTSTSYKVSNFISSTHGYISNEIALAFCQDSGQFDL